MTRITAGGYVVPLPTDPVRDGATVIANLGDALRPPEMFSGQQPWFGAIPANGNKNIRHVVIQSWTIGTDQFGQITIPTGFSTVLVSCQVQLANFRDLGRSVSLNPESKAIGAIVVMIWGANGAGVASSPVTLQVDLWGY